RVTELTIRILLSVVWTRGRRRGAGPAHPCPGRPPHHRYDDATAKGPGENWWNGQDKFAS
ncbi:hypothetical protein ACFV4P_34860, partial [Kitasatospora sp. NPDC059795]|uniref:hypothetical protein n=1 Tax=Kitasatospora sp. NPDC059795 TaxID=3346949 RepID=UPI00364F5A7B